MELSRVNSPYCKKKHIFWKKVLKGLQLLGFLEMDEKLQNAVRSRNLRHFITPGCDVRGQWLVKNELDGLEVIFEISAVLIHLDKTGGTASMD